MTREEKIDWLCRLRSDLDVWMPEMNKYKKMYKQVLSEVIEVLSEPTKTDILSDIADLKKSPWFTFGENSLNPISREQYLARKEAVEVIEDLCIKQIDSEPTKTDTKSGTIDKGKVLDILIKHDNEICSDTFDEMWKEVDALPFIEPTKTEPKWISVDERLPEYSGNYLITIADSNYKNGQHFEISWFYPSDCAWSFRNADVIAWMPLPEPYKAESEE